MPLLCARRVGALFVAHPLQQSALRLVQNNYGRVMTKAQTSKADKIRKLLHLGDAEIARRVGCGEAYVRAVRQRTSSSGNPITRKVDQNWYAANHAVALQNARDWRLRNPDYHREYHRKRRAEARAS